MSDSACWHIMTHHLSLLCPVICCQWCGWVICFPWGQLQLLHITKGKICADATSLMNMWTGCVFLLFDQSIISSPLIFCTVFSINISAEKTHIQNAFTCCCINLYFSTKKSRHSLTLQKYIHNSNPLLVKMNPFLIWGFCPHKPSYVLKMRY